MRRIKLKLRNNGYYIYIGSGLLSQLGPLLNSRGFSSRAVIITNKIVDGLYGNTVKQTLSNHHYEVNSLLVMDGEKYKSLESAIGLYRELSGLGIERADLIVALGGGVIGDLAGFVAATYLRGIPLLHLPTTLLAQVDSSIGGKVAVNYGQIKNKIGMFYQPKLVISDIDALKTLPPEQIDNGLAEIIKYAVIKGNNFFTFLMNNIGRIKSLESDIMQKVIFKCSDIKARIVEKDERDLGLRNTLNFGHTIGHGIESAANFEMSHGHAVAIGMVMASRISYNMGILKQNELDRLEDVIKEAGLPVKISNIDAEKIIEAIQHDKKIAAGRQRFVLPRRIGEVFISDKVDISMIKEVLAG